MITLRGRGLRSLGAIEIRGPALVSPLPVAFLGYVDPEDGVVKDPESPIFGQSIESTVFFFPRGVGSTVGPYVLLNLARKGRAPLAMINGASDQGTVAGASVSGIPLAYGFDRDPIEIVKNGDLVRLRLDDGEAVLEIDDTSRKVGAIAGEPCC